MGLYLLDWSWNIVEPFFLSEGNFTHLEKLFLKEHKNMLYPMYAGINFTFSIRDQTITYGIIC